jgi:hypothetical protein
MAIAIAMISTMVTNPASSNPPASNINLTAQCSLLCAGRTTGLFEAVDG